MEDDYRYQQKLLPRPKKIGGDTTSAVSLQVSTPNFPFGSDSSIESPFQNPDSGGGGGGGGPSTPGCSTSWSIGTIGTGRVNLPCTEATAFFDANHIEMTSGGDVMQITMEAGTKSIFLTDDGGDKSVHISPGDLPDDAGDAAFKVMDVIHMGQAGYRAFLCSESYTEE